MVKKKVRLDQGTPDTVSEQKVDTIDGSKIDSFLKREMDVVDPKKLDLTQKPDASPIAKVVKDIASLSDKDLRRILTVVLNRLVKAEEKILKLETKVSGIHKASK